MRRTPPPVSRAETPVGHLAALARVGDPRARAYVAAHRVTPEEVARACDLDARECLRATASSRAGSAATPSGRDRSATPRASQAQQPRSGAGAPEIAPVAPLPLVDRYQAARDLAAFIRTLHHSDPVGGPEPRSDSSRGVPLARRDVATRAAIAALHREIDVDAVTAAWEDAVAAPVWPGPPVWIHGDIDARNLLVNDGRLSAVIDFGCLTVGDPPCDVMRATSWWPGSSSRRMRGQRSAARKRSTLRPGGAVAAGRSPRRCSFCRTTRWR